MNSKTFEVLKWFVLVIIPALAIFVGLVGKTFGWQYTGICIVIITDFGAFLGSMLGMPNRTYRVFSAKNEEGGNK